MTGKGCLAEIQARLGSLSGKERRIADFILATPREAVHPSIDELAELVGVSETTLFRFVRKLGYGGYQQFRIALATDTVDPRETVYETGSSASGGEGEDGSTFATVFRTDIAALERALRLVDRASVTRAAELVAASSRVLLFGLGGSGIVALDAYHRLLRTGVDCQAPMDFHLQLMAAAQARRGDLGIVFSHTGTNKDALALAEALRESGAGLLVLTDGLRSPLARLADHLVLTHAESSRYTAESFSARIVQLAIVDAIYVDLMRLLGERGTAALGRMRAVIAGRRN